MQRATEKRRPFISDSGFSSSHDTLTANDVAGTVFRSAPFWVSASSWHCRHPDSNSESSFITINGPHTSEEVHMIYKNRQMKGSNLVAGLTTDKVLPNNIPAAFFRTLAYVFELAKNGESYTPVTEEDLARGAPSRDWCQPLWGAALSGQEAGHEAESDAAALPGTEQAVDGQSLSTDFEDKVFITQASERLLSSSPFWCYLYSHDPTRAKKTPPKTAEQMLAMHRAGCLPDWTPLLGLDEEVATFNSLPPCLFHPLGSLLHMAMSTTPYKPVGLVELNRWDKFIESRTAIGSTQGAPASAAIVGLPGQTPLSPQKLVPSALPHASPSAFSNMYYQRPPSSPGFLQPQMYSSQYSNTGMMWYGNHPAPAMYPGNGPQLHPHGSGQLEALAERSSDMGPQRPVAHERIFTTQLSSPARINRQLSSKAPLSHKATPSRAMAPPGQPPHKWDTAIFRLFTADATRGACEPVWWYYPAAADNSSIAGPLSSERMILLYVTGTLSNKQHYACGAVAGVPTGVYPRLDMFECIGDLLSQVEKGGEYHLYSVEEVMGPEVHEVHRHEAAIQGMMPRHRHSMAGKGS